MSRPLPTPRPATLALLATIAILMVLPLLPLGEDGGSGQGTDQEAARAALALAPDYRPWAAPLWQPPSPEIESLLFTLQAALGAGVLGFCLGRRGRPKGEERSADRPSPPPARRPPCG